MRTWSDAEILAYQFELRGRPDNEPGLVQDRPSLSGLRFVRAYNAGPPADTPPLERRKVAPYVWCVLCQEATNWRGWIAENAEGHRFLMGNRCARKHGAPEIAAAEREFNAGFRRKKLLERRDAFLARADELEVALHRWMNAPPVAEVAAWQTAFARAFPQLWEALERESRTMPAVLFREIRVRDIARERQRAFDRGDNSPLYRVDQEQLAVLPAPILMGSADLQLRIQRLARRVRIVRQALQHEGTSAKELTRSLKDAETISAAIEDLAARLSGVDKWNDRQLWRGIAQWGAAVRDLGEYKVTQAGELAGREGWKPYQKVRLPAFGAIALPIDVQSAMGRLIAPDVDASSQAA